MEQISENNIVWREVEILKKEIGSRILDSINLSELIRSLTESGVISFDRFTVWRFDKKDRLEYPPDQIHKAIDDYDVSRIYGGGYLKEERDRKPSIEIDLWAGGNLHNWDWFFSLKGPKVEVDKLESVIRGNIDRWPKTNHSIFHASGLWWSLMTILLIMSSALTGYTLYFPQKQFILILAIQVYLIFVFIMIITKADKYSPYIWFYRRGGIIESKNKILPRLTIGALTTIVLGIVANLILNILF